MNLQEAVESTRGNYSFTFTIPSTKNVYWQKVYRPYGKMPQFMQYDFLENHLQRINKFHEIYWVYEEHLETDLRLHIHGWIIDTNEEEVKDFIDRFYKYPVMICYNTYYRISNYQKTIFTIDYFKEYCAKYQNKIKYYMSVIEDKKHSANLDGKKFKLTIDTNLDAHYFNSLERNQENRDMGDDYLFGKNKKFLIEF